MAYYCQRSIIGHHLLSDVFTTFVCITGVAAFSAKVYSSVTNLGRKIIAVEQHGVAIKRPPETSTTPPSKRLSVYTEL